MHPTILSGVLVWCEKKKERGQKKEGKKNGCIRTFRILPYPKPVLPGKRDKGGGKRKRKKRKKGGRIPVFLFGFDGGGKKEEKKGNLACPLSRVLHKEKGREEGGLGGGEGGQEGYEPNLLIPGKGKKKGDEGGETTRPHSR